MEILVDKFASGHYAFFSELPKRNNEFKLEYKVNSLYLKNQRE